MQILLSGASGFLGRFLKDQLEKQNHEVIALNSKNCDLRDSQSLEQYNSISFDQIYHLAAWIQAGDFHLYHSGEIFAQNQLINTNLLNWWMRRQPQAKCIAMGTSCAYAPDMPLKEEFYLEGQPHASLYPYAMTKRMLYIGLEAMRQQYDMQYLYLVPSTLYGPGYHTDHRQLHFIFDLIRKILRAKRGEEKAVLWGNGEQKRELVHVQDFVNLMLTLNETNNNEIINIGAGQEYSIRHFAELICACIDYDPSLIEYDTSRFVGAKSKCLNTDKLKEYMPSYQMISLKEGLSSTIDWFINSFEKKAAV